MELDDPFAEWIPLTTQVPRKDQLVRVMTIGGIEHRALFTVAFTTDWPEGASWTLQMDDMVLSFWDVWLWSPNPDASAPSLEEAWTPEPVETPAPSLEEEDLDRPPEIAIAILDEVGRGKALLAELPAEGLDWTPQPSIPTLRVLACRMIRVLERIEWIVGINETERMLEPEPIELGTVKEIQDAYANGAKPVRTALESLADEALAERWNLTVNGKARVEISRAEALLVYGFRPLAAVGAELSVLLRALGLSPSHPTPAWPFLDEPEALILPEDDEPDAPEPEESDDVLDDLADVLDDAEAAIPAEPEESEADAVEYDEWTSTASLTLDERRRIKADRRRRA